MQHKKDIGFGKKIRAKWLDSALGSAAEGKCFEAIKEDLTREIAAENPGPEAVRKILACINRVWFNPPDYCRQLHQDGLRFFRLGKASEIKGFLHWGMSIAAYPFVGSVAESIGRFVKLQGEARIADIARRLGERFGDRDFVQRIARYNVSSFLDWGAIAETKIKGVYVAGKLPPPKSHEQLAWLIEAILHTSDEAQFPFSQLSHNPMLFPFRTQTFSAFHLRCNPRLRIVRHGLNEEWVSIESSS